MSLRCVVVGYGSIGARHAEILETLGHEVAVVSRRGESDGRQVFRTLSEALDAASFDYVVVAPETARHRAALVELTARGYTGSVLVEKPLFANPAPLPNCGFRQAGVGYNLRFHPTVQALRAGLINRTVATADFYVGQWLGDWRPNRDVPTTYSTKRSRGGGVLRDLSHELDLATWLFGPWHRLAALGGRLTDITRDADDAWSILLSCERCPVVTVRLNCLDRDGGRAITVHGDGETWRADLIGSCLTAKGRREKQSGDRNASYVTMHRALLTGAGEVASFAEGLATLELIAAVERAGRSGRWVERSVA